jgi:hypothetical protein
MHVPSGERRRPTPSEGPRRHEPSRQLPGVTDVFDFARFSYDNVVAEDGHVEAVFNIGVTGTDAIIKIARMKPS